MLGTFLALFLAVIGVLVLIGTRNIDEAGARSGGKIVAGVLIFFAIVLIGFKSLFYVSATEVGVPITFGKVGHSIGSGIHAKAPWTSIETLPVRPFTLPEDVSVATRTNQGGTVTVKYGARWQVDRDNAGATYLQVRTGDEDKISKEIVEKSLATAVRNVYANYDSYTATTATVVAEDAVFKEVNRALDVYGVNIDKVFLREVDPDDKTSDSLKRLAASKNETEIAKQNVLTAVENAKAAEKNAEGAKAATAQIPVSLSPQQVTLYCAQLWAEAQQQATAKGTTLWTTPCGTGAGATALVQAK